MNKQTVKIGEGYELELLQEDPAYNTWELVMENEEDLTLGDLTALNQAGFVYHSSIWGVDYEDELEDGTPYLSYMDIHYFSYAKGIHEHHMPL